MKKIFFIMVIGCLYISSLVAQNYNVNYNSCTGCTTTNPQYNTAPTAFTLTGNGIIDVVSDFGRRNGNGISNWHRGVDITLKNPDTEDNGYHLLSITQGLIGRIQGYAGGFKLISIDGDGTHDFGYAHIFFDKGTYPVTLGDMTIQTFINLANKTELVIIYHPIGGVPVAYANSTNVTVSFTDPFSGSQYSLGTTNQVNQNTPIAPLGTSGNVASHLHLYHFVDPYLNNPNDLLDTGTIQAVSNCKDPIEFIDHYATEYELAITTQLDANGSNSSEAKVRVTMNTGNNYGPAADQYYAQGLMNIDQVELLIKPTTEQVYQAIKGSHYDLRICENSRTLGVPANYDFYPSASAVTQNVGSYTQQGINPFAYGSLEANSPYDDFYFLNFKTRIHKNDNYGGNNAKMAPINDLARYPDQKYHLYAEATTVNAVSFPSDPTQILIDNFRPYIKDVLIAAQNINIYHAYWE